MESTQEAAPLSAPMTLDAWISGAHGDSSGLWFQSTLAKLAFPESFVWGEMASAARLDTQAAKRYFSSDAGRGSIIGSPGSDFVFAGGELTNAWPANPTENEYTRVRDSDVDTLLVGGELDVATPPQVAARELLPHLRNGRQVVLPGIGHTTSFWSEQKPAATRLLSTYFDTGRVDRSLYKPGKIDFTPEITQTALGKGIAGTLYGLPAVALFSLLLLWRRSRKRVRIGRTASVLLRSVFTVVLGLAGWFAGVVVVLLAFPTVPLDDPVLGIVSIGVPIALGVYLAWVDRDRSRRFGLVWSLAGALVGAWAGFQAGTGLLAVITTIVGAAVAANLAVLALDIARDRRVGDRVIETIATETLEARTSAG